MTPHTLHVKVRSAKRLNEAMLFRGHTNRSLAARTGIHRASIAHWRSGRRNRIGFTDAILIADALDMPTNHLFDPEPAPGAQASRRAS